MNKTELIKSVAAEADISKKDAERVVEATLEVISNTLASGEPVKLVNFGNFEVKNREARKGQNPKLLQELREQGVDDETAKAKATVDIPASVNPTFKAAKGLKDKVNA